MSETQYCDGNLIVLKKDNILTIKLNRPKKKNAINSCMLSKILELLQTAKNDDSIKIIYLTSEGDFHSAGNDFNNFSEIDPDSLIQGLEILIDLLIDYPKVLAAGIKGLCVGITFTMLLLFDIVLASDNAAFTAPFVQTYQCPEACSSLLFPFYLGKGMAGHLLLNGGVMTASEAKNLGLLSQLYEHESFETDSLDYLSKMAKFDLKTLKRIKRMMSGHFTKQLKEVNRMECRELRESWNEPEFKTIIKKFVKNPKF